MVEGSGMTDKQFKGYIRLLLLSLENVADEEDGAKMKEKLEKVIDTLLKTLQG